MNATHRAALIIWGSLGTAMLLYALIVFVKKKEEREPPQLPIVLILGAAAASAGLAALGIHVVLASPDRVVAWARQATGGDAERMPVAAWARWRQMSILAWALGESTVLLGVVAAFVKNEAITIVPFLFFGLAIHALMFPRAGALAAKLRGER